jgi:hypothetical protein
MSIDSIEMSANAKFSIRNLPRITGVFGVPNHHYSRHRPSPENSVKRIADLDFRVRV